MGILIEENETVFHLQTERTSYIMAVKNGKHLAHVYWGKRIHTPDISHVLLMGGTCFDVMEPIERDGDESCSLNNLRQEYPTGGDGDYRVPALDVEYADGSRSCPLYYCGYRITEGKGKPEGLPAIYAGENEAQTLEISLSDEMKGLQVYLIYSVLEKADAIVRSVRIENHGKEPVRLHKVMSASVDFEQGGMDMLCLPGAWGRERHIERVRLHHGECRIGSSRGASSHQMNPFLAVMEPCADECHGNVYSMNLVYSGNFMAGTEVEQLNQLRFYMGLGDDSFSWILDPSEGFAAPEAVMVFSDRGLGEMSRIYHRLYRRHLVRGRYRDEARPVLANNWEATYFDFDEEKIVSLADEAAGLGIELLVLDDGWFGKREDDRSSLGDWYANTKKLPNGLKGLADKVVNAGVKFGLWLEPEMVSADSDLYRAHPDWCLHVEGRRRSECRNQLTLDLSRKDVCDWLIETVHGILGSAPISYIKWDMNRHMSNAGSAQLPAERQKEVPHRYMLGLYRVLEEITTRHPDVLFESCSGGGGRFDPGMLHYMPQTWTSDDTDPVERLFIQYGTSIAYPVSAMGAHVSASPNHQSGRETSLKMRGDVAMSGNFGYELDLNAFTEEEKKEVREQISKYKEIRSLVMNGDMYRLSSPFDGNTVAWMYVSREQTEFFFAFFRIQAEVNAPVSRVRLQGIQPDIIYLWEETGSCYRGDELMEIGLVMDVAGDYQSITGHFKKIRE